MDSRRNYAVALLSGVALAFAYPEPDLSFLAWVAIAPLLLVARDATPKRGAALGFVFGVGFFGVLLLWISAVGWVAWFLLLIFQASFLALFGAAWGPLSRLPGVVARVALAVGLWGAVEYLRQIFPIYGFTWGQLAQSQHNVEFMLRYAGLAGGVFLGMVIVAVNALVAGSALAIRAKSVRVATLTVGAAVALLLVPLVVPAAQSGNQTIDVAIVQGNVDPAEPPSLEKELGIVSRHSELTHGLEEPVDLVVWPESSVGVDPDTEPLAAEALSSAARSVGVPMLVGANRDRGGNNYLVVMLEVSPDGEIVDQYQKTHLVPFGEYVPARDLLGWIPMLQQVPRDAVPGDEPKVFDVAGGQIATVLSFEGDFGSLVRDRIGRGGRLLVVATNTSTWGRSWASAQHLAFSQVRAAENGVWVLHAAISGISAFVRPDGRVVESTDLYTKDVITQQVAFADTITPYARVGDLPAVILIVVLLSQALLIRRRGAVASSDGRP
jgi:apolipoprotein N-acyltransferase